MIENCQISIAVIVEDPQLQNYITQLLIGEDYQVVVFDDQRDALRSLDTQQADLIIAQYRSTNIDGLNLCQALRRRFAYHLTPMVFLVPDAEPMVAAKLTYAGADDFIKIASVPDELFLKVKLNLYRTSRHKDINSSTNLPGMSYLLSNIEQRTQARELFAVCALTLRHLDAYNYTYGFRRGDALVKGASSIIIKAIRYTQEAGDFAAQVSNNRFIYTTRIENSDLIADKIISEYKNSSSQYFKQADIDNGYILYQDRFLRAHTAPLVNISIAALVNDYFPILAPSRIIQIINEIELDNADQASECCYHKEEKKNYPLL